jgi:hypothetical protein
MRAEKLGIGLLVGIFVLGAVGLALTDPIAQSSDYHRFSDEQTLAGMANALNVLSNLPFLLVGVLGIWESRRRPLPYLAFFAGVALVGLGSGYYHLQPNDHTLVWDRLPMTLAFMALCAILATEFINEKLGQRALWPLLALGLLSVAYWVAFNDLRPYVLVQFYPVLALPVVLLCFPSGAYSKKGYWMLALSYLFAKAFEHFDFQIHEALGFVSGHSLKHLAVGMGLWALLGDYSKRI